MLGWGVSFETRDKGKVITRDYYTYKREKRNLTVLFRRLQINFSERLNRWSHQKKCQGVTIHFSLVDERQKIYSLWTKWRSEASNKASISINFEVSVHKAIQYAEAVLKTQVRWKCKCENHWSPLALVKPPNKADKSAKMQVTREQKSSYM